MERANGKTTSTRKIDWAYEFVHPDGFEEEGEKDIRQALETRELDNQGVIAECQKICEHWPDAMGAYIGLAAAWRRSGNEHERAKALLKGYRIGDRLRPRTAVFPWRLKSNRPFLELAGYAVEVLQQQGRCEEALELARMMTASDTNDTQRAAQMVGGILLQLGRTAEAIRHNCGAEPCSAPMRYDLALAHHMEDQAGPAASALRRGLVENPYIGERLAHPESTRRRRADVGSDHPMLLSEADDYIRRALPLWQSVPTARRFVRWVTTHPIVVHEQGMIAHVLWQKTTAEGPEAAAAYRTELKQLVAASGEEHSMAIVMGVPDKNRKKFIPPWCVE